MGKWTLAYHDEVLRDKVKTLVQGAIKRMKTEKDGPSMTYESFVQDLEEGDSFTTSLVEVLVKELAERRTRPNSIDRRLVSERTAKSLRMLAEPLHIYRSGASIRDRARRSVAIPPPRPYSSSRVILSDSDGEEEYGTILDSIGRLEGAQINTDLYDAYGGHSSTHNQPDFLARPTDRAVDSPRPSDTIGSSWFTNSPPPRSPIGFGASWTGLGGAGSSSLTRQTTIRRPHRSRTMDSSEFTTFTSRRRSAIRDLTTHEDSPRAESSGDTVGETTPTENARSTEPTSSASTSRPLSLGAWMARRMSGSPSLGSGPDEPNSGPSTSHNPSSSQLWYSMTASSSSSSADPISLTALSRRSSNTDIHDDRRSVIAPRLRRGGLRPPESLLLQGPATPSDPSSLSMMDEISHVAPAEAMDPDINITSVERPTSPSTMLLDTHDTQRRSVSPVAVPQ